VLGRCVFFLELIVVSAENGASIPQRTVTWKADRDDKDETGMPQTTGLCDVEWCGHDESVTCGWSKELWPAQQMMLNPRVRCLIARKVLGIEIQKYSIGHIHHPFKLTLQERGAHAGEA